VMHIGSQPHTGVGGDASLSPSLSPPIAPSRFVVELETRRFTNGSDRAVVATLYRQTLMEGLGNLTELSYPSASWGDAEVGQLLETLAEIPHPHVQFLRLSGNPGLTSASMDLLDAAIRSGALPSLQALYISDCPHLTSLPAALASLPHLRLLDVGRCSLASLPDFSARPADVLQIKGLPVALAKHWDGKGRVALSEQEVREVLWVYYAADDPTLGARVAALHPPAMQHAVDGQQGLMSKEL